MNRRRSLGISTIAVMVMLTVAALGVAGWEHYQKRQARAAHEAAVASANARMDGAKAQWFDALRLATSTPRIGLAGPMGSLQSIRQNVEQIDVPACLAPNKNHLLKGMNEAIDGMLAFMRNDMGKYELDAYTAEKVQSMSANFAEYEKKPVPCEQKKT